MNKLNSLVIEGEVVESNGNSITLAYERNTHDANFVYYFKVRCNAELMKLKVGYQIRVVGMLQQNILTDEVIIVAEHIEVFNREAGKNVIPNE